MYTVMVMNIHKTQMVVETVVTIRLRTVLAVIQVLCSILDHIVMHYKWET